jgi:hypothetical protein
MPSIHIAALINYLVSCFLSVSANGLVIFLSLKMKQNGDFKWLFMNLSLTDRCLSLTMTIMGINLLTTDSGNTFIYSENPLIYFLGPQFCSFLYEIFMQWMAYAFLFSIALVSVNRYIFICFKSRVIVCQLEVSSDQLQWLETNLRIRFDFSINFNTDQPQCSTLKLSIALQLIAQIKYS